MRKRFWTPNGLFVTERVARSLPIATNRPVLPDQRGLFLFRVDADLYLKEGQEAFLILAGKYGIKTTWFVNIGNYLESPAGLKQLLKDDLVEVQSHAFRHQVYSDKARNLDNLQQAEEYLPARPVKGVVAPFGVWNENFQLSLEELGYQYSSEFGLAYDRAPFYPQINGRESIVLQIPIHPVCAGSFAYAGLPVDEACRYFDRVIKMKYDQGVPIILYGHPNDRKVEYNRRILAFIFERVASLPGARSLSFSEYYEVCRSSAKRIIGAVIKSGERPALLPANYSLLTKVRWLVVCLFSELKQRILDDLLPPGGKWIVLNMWKKMKGLIYRG
ncbi:polysaccharide deacetylase family protein [Candidatus Saganbacteria bacterium]|nr:polysaccharide deacetylase family protein [Candidatus Saganbacteria bacterium]